MFEDFYQIKGKIELINLGSKTSEINKGGRVGVINRGNKTSEINKGGRVRVINRGNKITEINKGGRVRVINIGNKNREIIKESKKRAMNRESKTRVIKEKKKRKLQLNLQSYQEKQLTQRLIHKLKSFGQTKFMKLPIYLLEQEQIDLKNFYTEYDWPSINHSEEKDIISNELKKYFGRLLENQFFSRFQDLLKETIPKGTCILEKDEIIQLIKLNEEKLQKNSYDLDPIIEYLNQKIDECSTTLGEIFEKHLQQMETLLSNGKSNHPKDWKFFFSYKDAVQFLKKDLLESDMKLIFLGCSGLLWDDYSKKGSYYFDLLKNKKINFKNYLRKDDMPLSTNNDPHFEIIPKNILKSFPLTESIGYYQILGKAIQDTNKLFELFDF